MQINGNLDFFWKMSCTKAESKCSCTAEIVKLDTVLQCDADFDKYLLNTFDISHRSLQILNL